MKQYNHLFTPKNWILLGNRIARGLRENSANIAKANAQSFPLGLYSLKGLRLNKISLLMFLILGLSLLNGMQLQAQTLDWNTFAGSTGTGIHDGSAVVTDASGNIYVCGSSNATFGTPINAKSSLYDGILVKYNSSGVRQWHTFFGGSGDDFAYGIDLDPSGNIYVSGSSAATWGTPLNAFVGAPDGLVIKFNSSGVRQWHTFFGAGFGENGYAIAVDASGNAYVTGNSQNNFGSPVEPYTGGTDGIVLKYNTSGARLWHSYFGGGSNSDRGQGIALDASNNVYVTGYSAQSWGSPIVAPAGAFDGILAKYNGSTGALVWNTFFGSSVGDEGRDVQLDASGNIYVTAQSAATWGTPLNAYSSAIDGALVKFNGSGVRQWNTFLGGTGDDIGYGITVDGSNNIYVTGSSTASWGTPVNAYSSGGDGFVARYNTSGARQSNTFFGSSGLDYSSAVTLDASDNVIVAANSDATWGTPVNAYAGSAGSQNIVVVKFNAATPPTAPGGVTGALVWLKADAGTSTTTSGTGITTWTNQAGGGDAVQSVLANRPSYRDNSVNIINFNPVVRFIGANSQFFDLSADIYGDGTARTAANMFTVAKHASIPTTGTNSLWWENGATGRINQHFPNNGGGVTWDAGSFGTAERLFINTATADINTTNPYLWSFLADGSNQSVKKNRDTLDSRTDAVIDYDFTNTSKYIGRNTGAVYFDGNVGEIIGYGTSLTAIEIQKIESYLAIKYGITLNQTTPTDYLASDGTIFWNKAINAYDDNIAGIARDDASGLNQKQSKSVNDGLQVAIGNGNTIAVNNILNTNNFTADKSALTWGSNGKGDTWVTSVSPAGYQRINRIWRVQEKGTVGSVKVQIPDNSGTDGLPAETTTVSLLVSSSNNFTTGATIIPMTLVGTNWEANVDFTTLQFFTFATEYNCMPIPARAPLGVPDEVSTQSNTAVIINVLTNDSYVTAPTVMISTAPIAAQGTAIMSGNNIIFTPNATFIGTANFKYKVTTADGADTTSVYIEVTNVPVVANNDTPTGANSGVTQTVNVKANDVDEDKAALTVSIITSPKGSATINGSGNIVYTPPAGFTGMDTLYYTVTEPLIDCQTQSATARVIFTVNNQPPVANPDTKTIPICISSTINLLANDTDPEGGVLSINSISTLSNPSAGILVNNNDGTITFTPATGFSGSVTFTYNISDDNIPPATSTSTTVTITVASPPVNNAPIANRDYLEMIRSTNGYISVVDNDTDPDNHPLSLPTITVNGIHGTAIILSNGLIQYTPNSNYLGLDSIRYSICDIINNPSTCSIATGLCSTAYAVFNVLPLPIDAVQENGTVTLTGGIAISNIRTNDLINGNPATSINSTISQINSWPSGINLNTTTGAITVVGGTPFGTYPVYYEICNLLNPSTCIAVLDTVFILPMISPITESGSVPATGGTPISNVRSNDTVNGSSATSVNSTIAQSGTWPSGITLNPTTGAIIVASGTTPGVYPVTYQLCDLSTPTPNCATVVDNITVTPMISPITESGSVPATGGTPISNVRSNDTVNGSSATSANSTIAQSGTWPSGITLNPTTGAIIVASGTTPGVYPVTYQLCDLSTPTPNCATVVDNITVTPVISPITESGSVPATGGTPISNIRSNDTVNGSSATSANSTIAQSGTWPSGITLNPTTGAIIVASGTTPGVYPVTYQLCDLSTPTPNCATVVDNITVTPVISPITESGSVPATGGTPISNVRSNDTVNGIPATSSNSTISQIGTWPSGISLNTTTGAITVASGTTPGVYPVTYQLCDLSTPTPNCATVVDNITVNGAISPITESGSVPATGGTPISNVRSNDTVNGIPATSSNSTISQIGTWPSGISLNTTTGAITVASGTTPGVYPVTYQLCDLSMPTPNCATVVDNITVTAVISPITESGSVPATGGTPISNVRSNDTVNGIPATSSNSTISQIGTWPSGISLNTTTGAITVASGTTPGVYPVTYQLCDLSTPTPNCATVVDNITVTPVISPITESGIALSTGDIPIANVRVNDMVNGIQATSSNSTIAQIGTWPSGISLNTTTGAITVASGTTPSVYPVTYQLCDLSTPTPNCATVVDNITVTAVINPITESGSVPATGGTPISNVRSNDTVNGSPATSANSTIAQIGTWPSGISLNTTTGAIIVASGTTPSVYSVTYQLCDLSTPTPNCATVVDNITVTSNPNNPPIAINDIAVTPQDKPFTSNVLTNDDDPDDNVITAITTPISNPNKGIVVLNPNGIFTYTPNTGQTGEDQFCYAITDGSLRDTACVTINIIPNPTLANNKPVANDDHTQTPMNTSVVINVKANDTDSDGNNTLGIPTPLSITTTKGGTMANNNDGTFTYVPPTGFIGKDFTRYSICDNGNPSLCDTAWITIEVIPTPLVGNLPPVAMDDAVLTNIGTPVTISVKNNDFDPDGGVLGSPSIVTPTVNGLVVVNPNGTVTYTPSSPTFIGSDVFTYQICDNGSPSKCDTATVVIGIMPIPSTPILSIAIASATKQEGNSSTTPFTFTVTRTNNTTSTTTVDWAVTSSGINPANTTDFGGVYPNGTVTFAVGETTKIITVNITGDLTIETDETFAVTLSNPSSPATISTAVAIGSILNDDDGVKLLVKVLLQGAYNTTTGLMRDDLRSKNLLPLNQPYNQLVYSDNAYSGTETTTNSVLAITGNNAIVDWVLVELRDKNSPTNIFATRAALVQRDGDVVDVDGVSPIIFTSSSPSDYYVAVKHRNHLGVMTDVAKALTSTGTVIDFTSTTLGNYKLIGTTGSDYAQKVATNGKRILWASNTQKENSFRRVIYQGPNNDVQPIYISVVTEPANTALNANYILNGYLRSDVTLDGRTIYQGPNNEVDTVYFEVITFPENSGILANYIITQQIP